MFLWPFQKKSLQSALCTPHHTPASPTYSCIHSHFFEMVSLSFGAIRRLLMVLPPLKCTWIPILPKNDFEAFTKTLLVGYHHMDVAVIIIVVLAVADVVMGLCGVIFVVTFDLSLLRAQIGYLDLCKIPFMCSSSLCNNCWLAEMVFALFVRVLNRLNLADGLWWLSQ